VTKDVGAGTRALQADLERLRATSILNYLAWHLGIRPEQTRSSARITYVGSPREKATSESPANGAASDEPDREQSEP
jgi:hypothetical protein